MAQSRYLAGLRAEQRTALEQKPLDCRIMLRSKVFQNHLRSIFLEKSHNLGVLRPIIAKNVR